MAVISVVRDITKRKEITRIQHIIKEAHQMLACVCVYSYVRMQAQIQH